MSRIKLLAVACFMCWSATACQEKKQEPARKTTVPARKTTVSEARKARPRPRPPKARPKNPAAALSWNFEQAAPGSLPQGWKAATGTWKVATDQTAPAGPKVLAQLAKSPDDVFNVAYLREPTFKDLRMSVRFRAVAGKVDQGGGLVWRLKDPKNYYIARYNPLEDNFRVYKVVGGHRKMLQSARLKLDHQAWHTLEVSMVGDHIECSLDGKKYLDLRDSTFRDAGAVGLWTKADAQTHFDGLEVRPAAGLGARQEKTKPPAPRNKVQPAHKD